MSASTPHRSFDKVGEIPPLREDPFEPDDYDRDRVGFVKAMWHSQDDLLRARDRQIEENIRMLLGQHWTVWDDLRQRFVDLSEFMTDQEKRWRQLPVINTLPQWFMLLHARFTENPPVITWQPGPDRIDAMLAEVLDPIYKYLWRETGMIEALDTLFSWLIPSGRAYLKSIVDPLKGDPVPFQGRAQLELYGPAGQKVLGPDGQPRLVERDGVPFDQNGTAQGYLEWAADGNHRFVPTGDPHVMYEGVIDVQVLSALEARGQWGPAAWHQKGWHIHQCFLTPLEVWERFGVEIEPDITGSDSEQVATLWRLRYSSGLFGAADNRNRATLTNTSSTGQEGFCSVYELWQPPSRLHAGMERLGPQQPGGRQMLVVGEAVVRDGPRYADFRYGSPIRCFDFVKLPGRPSGTSPQESMNGLIRTNDRLYGQMLQHATMAANPLTMLDKDAGLKAGMIKGTPNERVYVSMSQLKGDPVRYAKAPDLGRDVYMGMDRLQLEVEKMGQLQGAEGAPPTEDASGELVKELRYNSDRPIAPPLRRSVIELSRMAEDWRAMLPVIWDAEKIIQVAGDDGIARTITVMPELLEGGTVHAEPDLESMLPEGRGQRQARVYRMYVDGMFGMPGTPQAIQTYLDQARFPHLSRAHRPGGVTRTTAEQNIGKMLEGVPARDIPIFEWYEHDVMLWVVERYMQGPEFLKLDPSIAQEFVWHRMMIQMAAAEKALRMAATQGQLALAAQAVAPPALPPGEGGEPGAGTDLESEAPEGTGMTGAMA